MGDEKDLQNEITPQSNYLDRRSFLKTSIWVGSTLATGGLYKYFKHLPASEEMSVANTRKILTQGSAIPGDEKSNSLFEITHYNNFYEFSTDKSQVASRAKNFIPRPWSLKIGGLVHQEKEIALDDFLAIPQQERIYRMRCVEGWSMVIPWIGVPLQTILAKVQPLSSAKYVAFETFFDPSQMPDAGSAGIEIPYVEGLRLDEAMHPLTLIASGLYGSTLPPQNGAPLRLVVPWKYGFKSIKSIVKITLTDQEPPTTWHKANAREYGFYSNVNPEVDHPRWSQKFERRIGESKLRETRLFNGYADQVAALYSGMDLRKYY